MWLSVIGHEMLSRVSDRRGPASVGWPLAVRISWLDATRRSQMARHAAVAFVAVVAGAVILGPTPGKATAAALITCAGHNTAQFSPGLTSHPQTVTVTGQDVATQCLSLTHPQLRSFVGPFGGTAQLSCADLLSSGSGTETLYWNGSTTLTSTWAWTQSVVQQGTFVVATVTGPITAGALDGSTLIQTITVPVLNFDACDQPGGLTSNTGPSQWVFTNVI